MSSFIPPLQTGSLSGCTIGHIHFLFQKSPFQDLSFSTQQDRCIANIILTITNPRQHPFLISPSLFPRVVNMVWCSYHAIKAKASPPHPPLHINAISVFRYQDRLSHTRTYRRALLTGASIKALFQGFNQRQRDSPLLVAALRNETR